MSDVNASSSQTGRPRVRSRSPLSWISPMKSRPAVRIKMCPIKVHRDVPDCNRRSNASGIERPTMKRKAGKTTSASVMPSALGGWMWCIQEGAPWPRSLTKIIKRIVSPRRTSTEATRPAAAELAFATVAGVSSRALMWALAVIFDTLRPGSRQAARWVLHAFGTGTSSPRRCPRFASRPCRVAGTDQQAPIRESRPG